MAMEQSMDQQDSIADVISGIHDGLVEFMNIIGESQDVPQEKKQELASIIQGFRALVESLNQPGGEQPAAQPGNVPMEAGAAKVQPAL